MQVRSRAGSPPPPQTYQLWASTSGQLCQRCPGSKVSLLPFCLNVFLSTNIRFLLEKLKGFSKTSNRSSLEVDLQTVDGSFDLEVNGMGGRFTQVQTRQEHHPSTTVVQVYTNLKNVVARISPKPCPPGPRPALLLNCHFDSVPQVEQIFQPR